MHRQHLGHPHDQRDERDVLLDVVGQPRQRERRDDKRRGAVEDERVAVGRRLHAALDTEHAAHARDVLDDHRLSELAAHALRQRPEWPELKAYLAKLKGDIPAPK